MAYEAIYLQEGLTWLHLPATSPKHHVDVQVQLRYHQCNQTVLVLIILRQKNKKERKKERKKLYNLLIYRKIDYYP